MKPILLLTSLLPAFVVTSQAAVLARYDFETESNRRTSSDTELITTAGTLSAGIPGSFSGNTAINTAGLEVHNQHTDRQSTGDSLVFDSPVTGYALAGSYGDIRVNNTLAGALSNNHYIVFTIDLGSASSMDLSSFSFATDITNGTAAKNYWLLADVVGGTFAAADQIALGDFTDKGTETLTTFSTSTFTSDTEFRLYFDTSASTTSHGFALDNITLEGSITAIPEPRAALLGAIGILLLLRRRR